MKVLAAASKMFADRGYEAVTLRAIAEEIGYTHAVIYQHFPDKWHILAELRSETIGLLIQNFDAIAAKHPAPKERLFATSRGLIQFCTAHPQRFRNICKACEVMLIVAVPTGMSVGTMKLICVGET